MYIFSYDVVVSELVLGCVELGIMNYDVGFDVLECSEYNNENWECGKFIFMILDDENIYFI